MQSHEKPPEPEVNRDYRIVHSDDCILIIDKPANLPVHPSGIYHKNTLHHLLKEKFGDDFKAHFISRLDRETSGLMLMARTSNMARELQKQMRAGQIRKEYRALVDLETAGTAFPDYIDARGFLYPHLRSAIRKKQAFSADLPDDLPASIRMRARPVRTEFSGDRRKKNIQLIRARLHTGRMHQIRATLCSLGYPMIGDRLYGRDESLYLEMIQNKNPHQEAGNPLPSTLTFTGDGTTGHGDASRQCFNIEAISDANITGESLNITLGTITTADDEGVYTDKDPCDISVSVEDDDGPGVRVSNISNIMEEPGGSGSSSGTFRVRLRTAPTANVTMAVNDLYDSTNASHREGTADKSSLTFTNGNFATEQIVTINSVDDLEVDGQKIYTVAVENTSSADPDYNGLNPRDVVVINDDKSVPGYTYVRFDTTGGSTTSGRLLEKFSVTFDCGLERN